MLGTCTFRGDPISEGLKRTLYYVENSKNCGTLTKEVSFVVYPKLSASIGHGHTGLNRYGSNNGTFTLLEKVSR